MSTRPAVPLSQEQADGFYDVLLEGLSYLHDGSWGGFESAVESVDALHDAAGASSRDVARVLATLGHIDLQLDRSTLRPKRWCIAPPTLLRLDASTLLLCGRRPKALIAALTSCGEALGCETRLERASGQPARVTAFCPEGLPDTLAGQLAEVIRDNGHELVLEVADARHLAAALPTLAEVIAHLRRSTPQAGSAVERLERDGQRLRWVEAMHHHAPGSYRFNPPPVLYGYVESDGAVPVRVDARLARLLGLLHAGSDALAWDPQTRTAMCFFYAEPPGLYERAMVLCSGYAPASGQVRGLTLYRDVNEDVASAIYSRLSAFRQ